MNRLFRQLSLTNAKSAFSHPADLGIHRKIALCSQSPMVQNYWLRFLLTFVPVF